MLEKSKPKQDVERGIHLGKGIIPAWAASKQITLWVKQSSVSSPQRQRPELYLSPLSLRSWVFVNFLIKYFGGVASRQDWQVLSRQVLKKEELLGQASPHDDWYHTFCRGSRKKLTGHLRNYLFLGFDTFLLQGFIIATAFLCPEISSSSSKKYLLCSREIPAFQFLRQFLRVL